MTRGIGGSRTTEAWLFANPSPRVHTTHISTTHNDRREIGAFFTPLEMEENADEMNSEWSRLNDVDEGTARARNGELAYCDWFILSRHSTLQNLF